MDFQLREEDLLKTAQEIHNIASEIGDALKKIDGLMNDLENVWSDDNSKKYLDRYEALKKEVLDGQDATRDYDYKENGLQSLGFKGVVDMYGFFLEGVIRAYRNEFSDPTRRSVNG